MTLRMKLACAGVVAGGVLLGVAPAIAGPPAGTVGPHQHYVVTGTGERMQVGPNACEDGPSIQFDNFHLNVHQGPPGARGKVIAEPCPAP